MRAAIDQAAEAVHEHICRSSGGGLSLWYEERPDDVKQALRGMADAALAAPDLDAAARAVYEADERCHDLHVERGHDTWERVPAFLRHDYREMALAARRCGAVAS